MPLEQLEHADTEIQSVDQEGRPAPVRIRHLVAAKNLFDKELEAHKIDALRRARLKGMINGNPPYDPSELETLGLGHMTNVNFLEMRAILDSKAAANYELFFEVPSIVEVTQKFGPRPDQPGVEYGSIVAEEFSKMCMDWSGFLPFMDKTRREADAYGLGIGAFRDKYDWRPRAFNSGSFLTHKHAEVDVEKLPYAILRDSIQIGELFRMSLGMPDRAKKEGWRIPAVRNLFKMIFTRQQNKDAVGDTYQTSMWESVEQQIRNGQSPDYEAKQFEEVDIVHLLVREIDDGKVSHYIFAEGADDLDDFLYVAERAYSKMSEGVWLLPYNNGDGYLHSVRGLASMIETHCDMSNRFLGQTYDAGKMQGSLLIQPSGPTDMSQISLIRMGPVTVLPHNVKAVQSSFQPNVSQLVQLRDLSSSIMRNNTGVFRQYSELAAEQQAQKTAYEVSQQVAREARSEKSNIAYDYEQVQKLYREMFRRATNATYLKSSISRPGKEEAMKFVNSCVLRGVPLELLLTPGIFEVYATRAIGMGSWGVRMDLTNQILSLAGSMDEQGRRTALRERVATLVGYRNVDKFFPPVNRDQIPSNETAIANLENNDMMEGSRAIVGSDQYHVLHLTTHAQLAMGVLNSYQQSQGQGMDLMRTLKFLEQIVPHMEEHAGFLGTDPTRKPFLEQIGAILDQLAAFYKVLASAAEKQQKEQAKQQQDQMAMMQEAQQAIAGGEQTMAMTKLQGELRLDEMKLQSLNSMRQQKTDAHLQLREQAQNAELDLKRRRMEQEMEIKRLQSMAKTQ